jgi:hypothetical protein
MELTLVQLKEAGISRIRLSWIGNESFKILKLWLQCWEQAISVEFAHNVSRLMLLWWVSIQNFRSINGSTVKYCSIAKTRVGKKLENKNLFTSNGAGFNRWRFGRKRAESPQTCAFFTYECLPAAFIASLLYSNLFESILPLLIQYRVVFVTLNKLDCSFSNFALGMNWNFSFLANVIIPLHRLFFRF